MANSYPQDDSPNLPTIGDDVKPTDGDTELTLTEKKAKREQRDALSRSSELKELQLYLNTTGMIY